MAIKPERNTNYPYLNESDQDALEDVGSQDQEDPRLREEIEKCFDTFYNSQLETQTDYYRRIKYYKASYKKDISDAYKAYFECITIRQFPLSNPNRPSIADCKKKKDKLIDEAVEKYERGIELVVKQTRIEEDANYYHLKQCVKKAIATYGSTTA